MATLYRTNGTHEFVEPEDGRKFKLEELQKHVGGYIEIVHRMSGRKFLGDEEGLLRKLPVNSEASELAGFMLVGNILSLSDDEWE